VASFLEFAPEIPIGNAIIYYLESYENSTDDEEQRKATIDLLSKVFDMHSCEKYNVRAKYSNVHNYLPKSIGESSEKEIKEAIEGEEQAQIWLLDKCKPDLPKFKMKNWRECISSNVNTYFESCKELIIEKIQKDNDFAEAFSKTVNDYAEKRETNYEIEKDSLLEELSWILSLPLKHFNRPIYLIHTGFLYDSDRNLLANFSHFQESVKILCPKIKKSEFLNDADFLMEYRNSKYFGYSHAMENEAIPRSTIVSKREDKSTLLSISRDDDEKNLLYSIIEKLPSHVFWLNRDNVYLGCNDAQAKSLKLESKNDIVGKTNRDFFQKDDADEIDRINISVMETGISYRGEETLPNTNEKSYLSHKIPLFDIQGKVIGLLGVSIDITDRKNFEQLEFKNKLQEIKILSQEEFRKFTSRMAHDIVSPLRSLENFINSCQYLKPNDLSMIRNISKSIGNIAEDLLQRYEEDQKLNDNSKMQDILVSLALQDIIRQREHQYGQADVTFEYSFTKNSQFAFMKIDLTSFNRMISNLINNAVESFEGKPGVVKTSLNLDNGFVKIEIADNGTGMPSDMVEKILNNISVRTTKLGGHGLGLDQVRDALLMYKGRLSIESKKNVGTKMKLTFFASDTPKWIADNITLPKGAIVVLLDDDESMHDRWNNILKKHLNYLTPKFFTKPNEAANFITFHHHEKDKIFLLSDYELRCDVNGLIVILETGMKERSFIVSSIHNDSQMQELVESSGIQILPKQFLNDIVINVE
jgi:signal transduction histidine kinase